MNNDFPILNLEKFAHSYQSFYAATCALFEEAEVKKILSYILTNDINSQYKYSNEKRSGHSIVGFLKGTYLTGEKEVFLSFFNEILPNILMYGEKHEWEYSNVPNHLRSDLALVVRKFIELIANSNKPSVFKLDFCFDKEKRRFRRKLDGLNTDLINSNVANLDGDNSVRYEECVAEFLSFKRDRDNRLFYNESLDRLKKVIENTLQNKYMRPDGTFPMIHKKKELSNILFDGNHSEFENLVEYVIKNVHHEEGGQPKKFTEKEYVYLWLELNKILYLLNRYEKQS